VKNSSNYIFRSVHQTDMKFYRQLRPATETSILKVVISPYLSEKSSDFVHSSRFWTGWTSRDQKYKKYKKVALDRLRVRQNVLLFVRHLRLVSVADMYAEIKSVLILIPRFNVLL